MQAKYIPIEKVRVAKRNPRVNLQPGDREYEAIKSSLQKWGQLKPLIINTKTGRLVDGHQRLKVMKALGWKKVWVTYRVFAKEHDAREATLALHTAEGKFDDVQLKLEVEELQGAGQDLGYLPIEDYVPNFGEEEIEKEVPTPPTPKKAKSKAGELYELGEHRLLCGDARKEKDVKKLMGKTKADMVFTDPPYGIKRSAGFTGADGFAGNGKPIARRQYKDTWDEARVDARAFKNLIKYSEACIIFGGNFYTDILPMSGHWIVWDKKNTMPTFGDCELAWTSLGRTSVKKYEITYNGLIGKEKERFHPTQKPVELPYRILNDYTKKESSILDLFGGSGSTLIACEQLKCRCFMMEIEPRYCDVIRKRWWIFTQGKEEGWEKGTPQIT